jgi:hypothetical protein
MTLKLWLDNGWLKQEKSSREEINALLDKIDRDILTACIDDITPDWRLAIAYNASLSCAHTALRACGYRVPEETGHHKKTIESMKLTLAPDSEIITSLQAIRKKRHVVTYDSAGTVSEGEVDAALKIARELRTSLGNWLRSTYPLLT